MLDVRPRPVTMIGNQEREPDLAEARGSPVGTELEVAERLGRLPAERRAEVVRHFFGGEPPAETGTASGVSRAAMSLRVRVSLEAMKR